MRVSNGFWAICLPAEYGRTYEGVVGSDHVVAGEEDRGIIEVIPRERRRSMNIIGQCWLESRLLAEGKDGTLPFLAYF